MNKKGFTLVELLVVIAIIAILSVVVIPSIITVNKSINERTYAQKVEHIESAAQLYGSNNEEIFNGADEVAIYVYELVNNNYLSFDVPYNTGVCVDENDVGSTKGCVINPKDKSSMNGYVVILRKENVGVVAELVVEGEATNVNVVDETLTKIVCDGFKGETPKFIGKFGPNDSDRCHCNDALTEILDSNNQVVAASACLISGGSVVNNYLKYGDSKANWRVIGVYKVPGQTQLSAKIITKDAF